MEHLKLLIPTVLDESDIWSFRQEFFDYGEDEISGDGGLDRAGSYKEWLEKTMSAMNRETCPSYLVTATVYIARRVSDNKIVGITQLRHYLNDGLLMHGGHIGYAVRPSERRKGYAREMLKLTLEKCKDYGILDVLVTCSKGNIGSAKTIMSNGGVLENEIDEDGDVFQRYWIKNERV